MKVPCYYSLKSTQNGFQVPKMRMKSAFANNLGKTHPKIKTLGWLES
jgi:hypothetical protein